MKTLNLIPALLVALLMFGCSSPKQQSEPSPLYVAAYIWPSCHDDSLGHHYLWPEGIGEWEVIKQGDPRYEGHYQPKQPLWGYEMDNDPVVVEKWIKTALSHGINTFIYDWYWFMNYPYLESALNDGFLKAPSNQKMNFYIMWANHDVKYNYWNYHIHGENESILFNPDVDWEQFKTVVHRVINQYFKLPNYLKFDGCPVMGVFSFQNLVRGFGSIEETAKAIAYFREEVKKAGFPDVHLQMTVGGGSYMSKEAEAELHALVDGLGINSISFYNMGGFDCDYLKHAAMSVEIRKQWDESFDIPLFPCVSVGWDDTPRFPGKGPQDCTRFHQTPEVFANYLTKAFEYVRQHPEQPRLITLNAWNEWVEGSYLLPDMYYGFGYLDAVKRVVDAEKDK
ncbi:MAG: glycoside hydrolase family 99-like domain-containing protein [Bacteroidales bacterium]|nr:glycoside hydrolase family 99-like domain-containing protein [Bacteroidales bacterium]